MTRMFVTRMRLSAVLSCTALALAGVPVSGYALDVDYRVGLTLLETDNIALTETNRMDETVVSPSLEFGATQSGSLLNLRARGNLQYLEYLDNTFSNELRKEFAGQIEWLAIPQRMHFIVEDYLTSQPTDVLIAFNPGNEQQVNVFSAGPRFYLRLADTTDAQLELRYGNTHAERTKELDGDRYSAMARILHDISATRSMGLHGAYVDVKFDRADSIDYRRFDLFAGFNDRRANLTIDINAGLTRLTREGAASDSNEPLLRAQADWEMSQRSTLTARVTHTLADAATDLIDRASLTDGPIIGTLTNAEIVANAEVFRNSRAALEWRYTGDRSGLSLSPYYQRVDYIDSFTPDQFSRGGVIGASYRLQPRIELGARLIYESRRFDDTGRRDRDLTYAATLTWTLTSHWSTQFAILRRDRNSNAIGQDYEETPLSIAIFYQR